MPPAQTHQKAERPRESKDQIVHSLAKGEHMRRFSPLPHLYRIPTARSCLDHQFRNGAAVKLSGKDQVDDFLTQSATARTLFVSTSTLFER